MSASGGGILNRTLFWAAALVALGADLVSKHLVHAVLIPHAGESVEAIPGLLWFSHHINRGAVWGIAHGHSVLLISLTSLIIPAVVLMAYACRSPRAPLWALGLMVGGATGNLVDRIRFDGVRDFIDLRWWPVFNVADAAIVGGVAVYLVWSLVVAPVEERRLHADASAAGEAAAEKAV